MKLTESELKQIIQEEIQKAIEEVDFKGNVGNVVKHRAKLGTHKESLSQLMVLATKAIDDGEPEKAKQYLAKAEKLSKAFG